MIKGIPLKTGICHQEYDAMDSEKLKSLRKSPRKLSLSYKFQNIIWGTMTLNGLAGWVFLSMGLGMSLLVLARYDFTESRDFGGNLRSRDAHIISIRSTGVSEGSHPLYAFGYAFKTGDGKKYRGVSYDMKMYKPGEKVTVEHPVGRPDRSRIKGAKTSRFSLNAFYFLFLPALGAYLILPALYKGTRFNRKLENYMIVVGRLKIAHRTRFTEKKMRVYRMTYRYLSEDNQEFTLVRRDPSVEEELTDDREEVVLYDGGNPQDALFYRDIPVEPAMNDEGIIDPANWLYYYLSVLVPVFSLGLFLLVILS